MTATEQRMIEMVEDYLEEHLPHYTKILGAKRARGILYGMAVDRAKGYLANLHGTSVPDNKWGREGYELAELELAGRW